MDRQGDLLDQWVEARRQVAAWEAKSSALLAERLDLLDDDVAAMPRQRDAIWRSMVCEYAAAGRIAKGSAEIAFTTAHSLRDDFPALREAFESGRVTAAHVREILRAAAPVMEGIHDGTVAPSVAALFESAALEFADAESPARTRAQVRELAAALVPQTVVGQQRRAESERKMWMTSYDDGVAVVHLLMSTAKAAAVIDRTKTIARSLFDADEHAAALLADVDADFAAQQAERVFGFDDEYTVAAFLPGEPELVWNWVPEPSVFDIPDACASYEAACERAIEAGPTSTTIPTDERTVDQAQADVACDLLLGADPTEMMGTGLNGIRAQVQVTVAATTLAGLDDNPAQLDGHGPIDPDIARALAGENNGWTRLFLDNTGLVTSTDTYTPTAGMRRFLRARDQHCRFPGCRMPVHRCQSDHTFDHALGGATDVANLALLCVTHHVLKHPDIPERFRWTAHQNPDRTIDWISPTGRTYVDAPPRRVMFVPSGPAPEPQPKSWAPPEVWAAADSDPPPWEAVLT